ncbi:hypothetical protein GCM10029963_48810 [Micromonospora andamanensis]
MAELAAGADAEDVVFAVGVDGGETAFDDFAEAAPPNHPDPSLLMDSAIDAAAGILIAGKCRRGRLD